MPIAQVVISADDDRVRLTTWTLQDGEKTGHHLREYDYVVVPVTRGTFDVSDQGGAKRKTSHEAAVAYTGRQGGRGL